MDIFGFKIIPEREYVQLLLDKHRAEFELKHRPTRDEMFKYAEELADSCAEPYKREIEMYQDLLRGRDKTNAELRERLSKYE